MFGFLRDVWEIFMKCEVNISLLVFLLFSPVCRIACHKKCEVKVRVENIECRSLYVFLMVLCIGETREKLLNSLNLAYQEEI